MARTKKAKDVEQSDTYLVSTPNAQFDGLVLGIKFSNGTALVDQATADRFKLEYSTFKVESANPLQAVQRAASVKTPKPLRSDQRIAALLELAAPNDNGEE